MCDSVRRIKTGDGVEFQYGGGGGERNSECNKVCGPGWLSRYSDSGDRIPVGEIFSASVQTGSAAHPSSRTAGNGSVCRG
jgi:hypothetical protein